MKAYEVIDKRFDIFSRLTTFDLNELRQLSVESLHLREFSKNAHTNANESSMITDIYLMKEDYIGNEFPNRN